MIKFIDKTINLRHFYLFFDDGAELFYGDLHVPKYHFAHKESKDPVNFSHDPSFTMELKP